MDSATSSPDSPIIDLSRLEEVCMADPEAMNDLAEFFFAQADQEISLLEKAVHGGIAEEIRRLAHRLIGASAGCGMTGMLSNLVVIENQAKAGDLSAISENLAALKAMLQRSRAEISAWRRSGGSEAL